MCQRVIVAMALAHSPKLRITDEPTAGLDVTLQVLGLMRGLVRAATSSVLLVSPDLDVIAHHRLRLRAPPLTYGTQPPRTARTKADKLLVMKSVKPPPKFTTRAFTGKKATVVDVQ